VNSVPGYRIAGINEGSRRPKHGSGRYMRAQMTSADAIIIKQANQQAGNHQFQADSQGFVHPVLSALPKHPGLTSLVNSAVSEKLSNASPFFDSSVIETAQMAADHTLNPAHN
jgi:hypothetical protein